MVVDFLFAIILSSNFVVVIADNVPRYDVGASCLGAAKQLDGRVGLIRRQCRCRSEQQGARDRGRCTTKLVAVWPELTPQNGQLVSAHRRPEVDPATSNCLFVFE